MATVTFWLRPNRANPDPTITVVLRQGATDKVVIATPFKVPRSVWDAKRGRIRNVTSAPYKVEVNAYLDELETAARAYLHAEALDKRPTPPLADIKTAVLNWMGRGSSGDEARDLLAFAKDLCDRLGEGQVSRSAKPVTPQTLVVYRQTVTKLTAYCKATGRASDLVGINSDFYRGFVTYLNGEGFSLNTVGKHVKTLKSFLADADAAGHGVCQDFRKGLFKGLTEAAVSIALSFDELMAIADVDLSALSDGHQRARDLFVLAAFTGLRFSDVVRLKPENVAGGHVAIVNKKTHKLTSAALLPPAEAVLTRHGGAIPAPLSNQKANAYLKEVAKLAGIAGREFGGRTVGGKRETVTHERWELVTTHTGRRSYVTLMEALKVDPEHIKRATGHSTAASYQLYNKTTANESGRAIRDAFTAMVADRDTEREHGKIVPLKKVS